ncbi:hypothetical protein MRB53_018248 [Persea americana]|uniref:Uncharacterized protein n=1 Tax=Persea americana TaxID=3435 RepID=A0ACC2M7H1_PERAE|nr:hypothetical protein MRB53_018248 [Persea americana]
MSAAYNAAMKGKWDRLKNFYTEAKGKPVTLMQDTVLHIVAHSRQPELMKCLIQISSEALNKPNNVGNTVLYEAATSGDIEMAKVVSEANKAMLTVANNQGETPLFGAAANGHTAMVRYLASQFEKGQGASLRRRDGTPILHIAMLGQYHDTALELLKLYPNLVNSRDENGLTGLHLLATMPFTFRSGCYMGLTKKLIYSCIPNLQTEEAAPNIGNRGDDVETGMWSHGNEATRSWFSSNYSKCLNIACCLRQALHCINVKVWNCLSQGWPVIRRACEEKMRHALALQLVKKLVEADMSWMESHIGGDPYKIRVFDQGKLPGSHDANRGHLANPLHAPLPTGTPNKHGSKGPHATHFPLPTTLSTALPHPPSSPEGDDGPPSEHGGEGLHATHFPLTTSLSPAAPQPPISPEGDDGPRSEHEGEGLHDTNLPSITTHSHALPNAPISSEGDGDHQPPSEPVMPIMEIDDDGPPLPLKLPPKATDNDSLHSPPRPTQPPVSPTIDMHMTFSNGSLRPPPIPPPMDMETSMSSHGKETPLLIAAGKGIVEIVEEILAVYPQAVEYINDKGRNILHVAVQRRQTGIFKLVCTRDTIPLVRLNRRIDGEGNSVLHHAAKLDENDPQVDHFRNIPGEALQMQWEIQWFKQVMDVVPPHFRNHINNEGEKASEVFSRCHKDLAKNGEKWLMRTANSCSLVATLIATVAFTSAYTVPGGPNQKTGHPLLLDHPAFLFFTISDTISLSFALTSVVVFLSIMTSRFHEQDFHLTLPLMLVAGLTSLFLAVSAMMVSFAATLVLMITQKLQQAAIPIFLVACFPVTIFLVLQFPLYLRVAWYTIGDILNKFRRSFSSLSPPRQGLKRD